MIGLLNIGSLVLGLIAWTLPVITLMQFRKHGNQNWVVFSMMSLMACGISLSFQIIYNNHLVKIEDWSALLDTSGAVVTAASTLLIVTILLNTLTLIVYRRRIVE